MNRSTRALALAIALVLAAPTGLATWMGFGSFEPDNPYDDPDFQWTDAPEYSDAADVSAKRIYFNAFPTTSSFVNPNVGALETHNNGFGANTWQAMLGVWVDCNDDGYVGHAESAMTEYRNELLSDKSRCPAGDKLSHNDGGWVTELKWIGRGNASLRNADPKVIADPEAMIWADYGVPFATGPEEVPAQTGGTCPLTPFPKGTFQSTGGLVNYVDCFLGLGDNYNDVAAQSGGALQPLADEDDWNEEGHPLNVGTFGSESAENTMLSAQDCSQPTFSETVLKPVVDPLVPEQGKELTDGAWDDGPRPLPPTGPGVNPDGNLPGTVNRTAEDFNGDCDTSNDAGGDFYPEGETEPQVASYKKEANWNFGFSIQQRGAIPAFPVGANGGPYMGGSYILAAAGDSVIGDNTMWSATSTILGFTPSLAQPGVNQTDPTRSTLTPWDADYFTFYAFVGAESLKQGVVPGEPAEYGAAFCPDGFGETGGVHYGWECHADLWYRNNDGTPFTETFTLARPGQPYNLRDVDCFDTGAAMSPLGPHHCGADWMTPTSS